MDFDEIEYLEKTVEEADDREGSKKKKKEGSDRSYRKRDVDENDDVLDERRGKKSRGDDENGSRHKRDRERDRDREKSKERRDREGDRDRDRERRERDREREKRERRDRDREEERERRERSSSRSRRYDSDRERDVDGRDSRRFREKKEAAEPEADPERDQRTVFAYQMPLKASERDAYEFFSKAGKVRDVRLIMDRNSRRSKGVGFTKRNSALSSLHPVLVSLHLCAIGYIEFYDAMSVPMAIALSGQLLLGQPVMVKPSEAEKNLVQSNASSTAGSTAGPYGPVDRKLYVGNLHFNMTEMQLRQAIEIFEPFGTVELVQMPLDLETGQCKGFGFVQFAQVESAKLAQSALNGKLEIAGRTIKVSSVTEHGGQQDPGAKSADFDDDDGGGLALNAQSRAMLMAKLDRTGIATSIAAGTLGVPVVNGSAPSQPLVLPINGQAAIGSNVLPTQVIPSAAYEPIGTPSECLLLKNMFDPATETEPDFDLDIKEDVEEECSKYGRVKHIFVDKNSSGFVYLRFDSVDSASRAQRAMHLRWFARRTISAIFMQPHDYEAKFGNVA